MICRNYCYMNRPHSTTTHLTLQIEEKGGKIMKKLFVMLLILLLFVPLIAAAESSAADPKETFVFRDNIKFGMSREEVLSIESAYEFVEYSDYIATYFQSAGEDAVLVYFFNASDDLYSVFVVYTASHTENNMYVNDFENIDTALKTKYGTPDIDQYYNWINSSYIDKTEYYGLAISMGYLTIISQWDLESVSIRHVINGDNYEITHSITYDDPYYEEPTDVSGI